jgi:PBSX family phage terminase large subunit
MQHLAAIQNLNIYTPPPFLFDLSNLDHLDTEGLNHIKTIVADEKYKNGKKILFDAIGYHPHAKQVEAHTLECRHKVLVWGRQSGKTTFAAKEAFIKAMQPDKRIAIVAPLSISIEKVFNILAHDLKKYLPANEIVQYSEFHKKIVLANGTVIQGFTAKNIDAILGDQFDLVIIDEAAKMKSRVWEKFVRATLVTRKGDAIFITTPEGRRNWIYEAYIRGQKNSVKDWASFHCTSYENPGLIEDGGSYLASVKATTNPRLFAQEYLADFSVYEGMVYDMFDPAKHCVDYDDIMQERLETIFYAVDWGYNSPSAILVIGVDSDSVFYVLEEVYKERLSDDDIVREFKRLNLKYPKAKHGYADHTPRLIQAVRNKTRIHLKPAKKDVVAGVQHVATKMTLNQAGYPTVYITWNCKNLIDELEQYCYPKTSDGVTNIKEIPVKLNDHACDALRYGLYTHEKGFKYRSNFIK